jgi:oligoribonuclease
MSKRADLLWIDLEMTGLDVSTDSILEVGLIATDWDFKEIVRYHSAVKVDEALLAAGLRRNHKFWDLHPETRNDLITQNRSAQDIERVEKDMLRIIKKHFTDQPVTLAGNSIHMDRQFIDKYLPKLSKKLHYRMLDVSAWKLVFMNKYGVHFQKPDKHRSIDDIAGSIEEMQYYLQKINSQETK